MKYFWFSAYDEQTSAQFGYTTRAVDTSTAMKQFYRDNPHGEIADYGWEEEEE
jgi:hypothetical protein